MAVLSLLAWPAFAQSASDTGNPESKALKEVTVTGNPLGASDLIVPAAQLSGVGLLLRSQSTLGETLNGTPGVSSTYFGPNASRPIIRGLDGDRIRILGNGGASIDASSLSYDHAVTADPISIERVEVLRGPGALLYGGNAVGGVVNVIDSRIPREPIGGFGGKADLGYSSGKREKSGAVMLEGGDDRYALHVDAFGRDAGDVRAPADLACAQGGVPRTARRICNSASDARGGALGGSVFFDRGYLGASVSSFRSNYGTVAEDDVTIAMRSERYAVEGLVRDLGGWLQSVKAQASYTDYRHTELEAGVPGTVFSNQGSDFRIEARHAPLGPLSGMIGLQGERTRFAAEGEEAFAPASRTRQQALFAYEELATGWGKLSFGARTESVRVESLGSAAVPRFATGERSFRPGSVALGALWKLDTAWQLTANVARSERAPKDYELFANGPHLATNAWEVGNPALAKERSANIDVGLQWKNGPHQAHVSAFSTRFRNYISLERTGEERALDEESLPEYAYRAVRARFHGLEAGGTARLLDGATVLDLELRGDLVRATNEDTGEPLPRIAPVRLGATLVATHGPWGARLGFDHSARQSRVPEGDSATPGSTLWSAALTWRTRMEGANLLWYARLDNATDRLAYSATSILTQTAAGRAPLPGRSVRVGVQATF